MKIIRGYANFKQAGVKAHTRRYKGKTYQVKTHKRKLKEQKKNLAINILKGVGTSVAVGGLSAAIAMPMLKKKKLQMAYRKNLKTYAENIFGRSSDFRESLRSTPRLTGETHTLFVGGAAADRKYFESLAKEGQKLLGENAQGSIFTTGRYNLPTGEDMLFGDYLRGTTIHKETRDLAEKLLAHTIKQPELKLNVIGHSYGGTVVNDAISILEMAGVKHNIKAVTFGAPNIGRTAINPRVKNIISDKDNQMAYLMRYRNVKLHKAKSLKGYRYPKLKSVKSPSKLAQYARKYYGTWMSQGHDFKHYQQNFGDTVRNFLH